MRRRPKTRRILRGNCDVAAQGDAVVGVLGSGEQSIFWWRWRVVQGDHVACGGDGRSSTWRPALGSSVAVARVSRCRPDPGHVAGRIAQRRLARLWRVPARWCHRPAPHPEERRWPRSRCRPDCDTSLAGSLRAAAVVVGTGSVVSITGAASARASLAAFPVSAGLDTSLVGSLRGGSCGGGHRLRCVSSTGAASARVVAGRVPGVGAGWDTSLVGSLRAAAVWWVTGSVVSFTGATSARASLAAVPGVGRTGVADARRWSVIAQHGGVAS